MFENYKEQTRGNLTQTVKDDLRDISPRCEICHKKGSQDIHHITEVQTANGSTDLNRAGNLLIVCEDCHNKLHGEDGISKSHQKEIASGRTAMIKSRINAVLRDRDMAVNDKSSTLLWLGLGALCAAGLYTLYKRQETMKKQFYP